MSSRFHNVGMPVLSGTDLPVINCLIEVGPASMWALPCGGQTLLEGCNITLLQDHNASATLFGPPQHWESTQWGVGVEVRGGQLIMINNQLPDMPLGVDGPSAKKASWVLVNNRFFSPALANWNRLMVVLAGADGKGTVAHVLASQGSESSPVSGLLFSGGGW